MLFNPCCCGGAICTCWCSLPANLTVTDSIAVPGGLAAAYDAAESAAAGDTCIWKATGTTTLTAMGSCTDPADACQSVKTISFNIIYRLSCGPAGGGNAFGMTGTAILNSLGTCPVASGGIARQLFQNGVGSTSSCSPFLFHGVCGSTTPSFNSVYNCGGSSHSRSPIITWSP